MNKISSHRSNIFLKILLLIAFYFLLGSSNKLLAQSKFSGKLEFYPLCVPFNKSFGQEKGLGYYSVKAKGKSNIELDGHILWRFLDNAGLALGFGYHNFRYEVNYDILNPIDESSSYMKNYRFFDVNTIGPSLSFFYHKGKFEGIIGIKAFQATKVNKSHTSSITDNFFFDPESGNTATLRIDERVNVSPSTTYSIGYFQLGYLLSKNIYCNLGMESNLSDGLPYHYSLKVVGNTVNTTTEEHTLNDFIFLNKYIGIKLGLSYNFNFKKKLNTAK